MNIDVKQNDSGHWIDATAVPYLREMKNLDAYFVGDAHSVASLGVCDIGVPAYIVGDILIRSRKN